MLYIPTLSSYPVSRLPPLLPDDAAHRLYKGKSSAVRSGRRPSKKRPKASARLFSPETTVGHELHAVQATLPYRKGHRSVPGRSGEGSPGRPVQDVRHARRQSGGRHRGRSKGPGCSQTSADEGRIRPMLRMRTRRLHVAHPYSIPLWDSMELDSYVIRLDAKHGTGRAPERVRPFEVLERMSRNRHCPDRRYAMPQCAVEDAAREGGRGGGRPPKVSYLRGSTPRGLHAGPSRGRLRGGTRPPRKCFSHAHQKRRQPGLYRYGRLGERRGERCAE